MHSIEIANKGALVRATVRSRRLGARISKLRQEAGHSGASMASSLGIGQPTLSKIETGKARVTPAVFTRLVEALNVQPDVAEQLDSLRRRSEQPGWWQEYGDILAEPVETLIELEAEAAWVRTYDGAVFPGLLQTRAYAERVIAASSPHLRVADIDRYLELRMRRQRRIIDGLRVTAVVGEAAVRQQVGGPEVLHAQLDHVMTAVAEHDITIQVVPFSADAHAALIEQFVLIEWPEEDDASAVYVDGQTSWTIHETAGAVRQYRYAFASVQAVAYSVRESVELIKQVTEELP